MSFFAYGGLAGVAVVIVGSLAVAWFTPYWPEALGVAGGIVLTAIVWRVYFPDIAGNRDAAYLVAILVVSVATGVTWRRALSRYDPQGKPVETRPRLMTASLLAAASLLLVNFFLYLGFGFAHCAGDTTPTPPPGSDLASYCDQLNGELAAFVLLGPSLLALVIGGFAALTRRGGLAAIALIMAIALTVAAHVPDFVVPG